MLRREAGHLGVPLGLAISMEDKGKLTTFI